MNKKLIGGLVAVLALVSVFGYLHSSSQAPAEAGRPALGGVNPEISSPWLQWGGINHWAAKGPLATATTTPCAIQSPNATSTLVSAALQITTATSTQTTWTLAKSATPTATTTLLSTYTLGSGVQGTMVATTTATVAVDGLSVFAPNTYLVWGVAGISNLTSDKLLGSCQAEFVQI